MSARQGYMITPTDYRNELKNKGQRLKAMAFIDYYDDYEKDEINSQRFYAKAWNVSKTTVQNWIKEFHKETLLFKDYWTLKNNAKNQPDHQLTTNRPQKKPLQPYNTEFKKDERPLPDQHLTKDKIIYNNNTPTIIFTEDTEFDKYFNELRFINKRYAGSKDKAYKSYLQVKEYLNIKILVKAYRSYITEVKDSNDKGIGFSRFIDENLYLPYLPKEITVTKDNDTIEGVYENEKLSTDTGVYEFSSFRYLEKLKNKEITFREVA